MTDQQHDPISRMPPQLQASNRKRRAAKQNGEPLAAARPSYEDLLERVEQLERDRYASQFTDMQPEPRADPRLAALEHMSDFTRKLLDQTHDVPKNFGGDREPPYNVPLRVYLKPDGTFVRLQGDAKNRALYQDKGYHLLNDEELKHYEEVEQPRILRDTRAKAALITGIRKLIERESDLAGYRGDNDWDAGLDLLNIEGLQDEWRNLCAQTKTPDRRLPQPPRFRSDAVAERDAQMAGVDTAPTRVAKQFEPDIPDAPRGSRLVEVTSQSANTFR